MKYLREKLAANQSNGFWKLFINEIKIATKLKHKNVVLSYGGWPGRQNEAKVELPYFCMGTSILSSFINLLILFLEMMDISLNSLIQKMKFFTNFFGFRHFCDFVGYL